VFGFLSHWKVRTYIWCMFWMRTYLRRNLYNESMTVAFTVGLGERVGEKQDIDCLIIFETGKTIHLRRHAYFGKKMFDNDDFFGLQYFIWSGAWKISPQVHVPTYYYELNSMYYSTGYYLYTIVQFTTLVLLASYYYVPLPNIIWVLVYHCSTCTYLHATTNLGVSRLWVQRLQD
jgi:hypothetical protein